MMSTGERLKAARMAAGYESAKAAAEAIGVPVATYTQHENAHRGLPAERARHYARFFDTTPEWLLYGRGPSDDNSTDRGIFPLTRQIPVRGVVQAGAWAEVVSDDQPTDWVAFEAPEYNRAELFALDVRGPSMNRVYPDGCRVICAVPAEAGLRDQDYVAVRRRRGSLVETTLKQLVVEKDGSLSLYPRSTDPAHQTPMRLEQARDADDGAEIVGVVIGKQEIGRAGRGPLIVL
jgi:phage repressor protein C with HTH and peptisase S24 domain